MHIWQRQNLSKNCIIITSSGLTKRKYFSSVAFWSHWKHDIFSSTAKSLGHTLKWNGHSTRLWHSKGMDVKFYMNMRMIGLCQQIWGHRNIQNTQRVIKGPVITSERVKPVQVKYSQPLRNIKVYMYACNILHLKIQIQKRNIYSIMHLIK